MHEKKKKEKKYKWKKGFGTMVVVYQQPISGVLLINKINTPGKWWEMDPHNI